MLNRCVKIVYKFLTVCEKKMKKCQVPRGGFFLTHTVHVQCSVYPGLLTVCIFVITNHQLLHHLTCEISSLLYSVNLNPANSPPGSPHLAHYHLITVHCSHPPSITPSAFHSRLKIHSFRKFFPHSLSGSIWIPFAHFGHGPDLLGTGFGF